MYKYLKCLFASEIEAEVAELSEAVARHQRIFRGSHGYGYFDWDLTAKRIDWSGGYWRYLGYTDEDVDYISVSSNYYDYVHPDDVDKLKEVVSGMLKKAGPGEITYRTRRKKGGYIWTELRADSVRDENGWVRYVSGIAFDVTKQRQIEQALMISEARHARVLQSSNDGIWEWAPEHGGFYFSTRCWEHLGFTEQDSVATQGPDRIHAWRKRMHPEDGQVFDQTLALHLKGEGPFDVEYRVRGKDDQWRWIRARGQMMFNDKNEPLRMSGTNMDITQLKLAEEKVLSAKDLAERANKAKSEFLSSMTHELRTPLNAILGFAQLIQQEPLVAASTVENAAEIRKAGEHLLQLIGDVLDLAKIEAGKLMMCMEIINPIDIIKECVNLLKPQAEMRGISIGVDIQPEAHRLVNGDKVRFRQVILNLMSNAIKYNREAGQLVVRCSIEEHFYLRVAVHDTGYGIPKELQSELFQPFNRLGAELGSVEGSGVGLVITKQLITFMGGRIDFISEPGFGSQFWVDMPLVEQNTLRPVAIPINAITGDESQFQLRVTQPKRILYIEDNPSNQRLIARLIAKYPALTLDIAPDALRGLYLARVNQPNIILMDINLPGISGYEALEVLKSDPATQAIPVIALTANARAQDIEKGKLAGFAFYLTKPLSLTQLMEALNWLLSNKNIDARPF